MSPALPAGGTVVPSIDEVDVKAVPGAAVEARRHAVACRLLAASRHLAGGAGWPIINASAPCLLLLNASDGDGDGGGVSVAVASPDNAAGPRVRIGMSGFAGELHCAGTGAAAADSTGGVVTSASTADGAVVDVLLPTGDLMGKTTTFRCARVSVSVS